MLRFKVELGYDDGGNPRQATLYELGDDGAPTTYVTWELGPFDNGQAEARNLWYLFQHRRRRMTLLADRSVCALS